MKAEDVNIADPPVNTANTPSLETIEQACSNWFRILLTSFDENDIALSLSGITQIYSNIQDTRLKTLVDIHLIRFYCKLSELEQARKQVKALEKVCTSFSAEQNYYWTKFTGNVHSLESNYFKAYHCYLSAESQSHELTLNENELADLYYSLGVTSSQLQNPADAISYTKKALSIYERFSHTKRCAQCHITLGISYRRKNDINKALTRYRLALNLADSIKDHELAELVNMNLAHLYSVQGDTDLAIQLYRKTLDFKDGHIEEKLVTILSLTREHYKQKNKQAVKSCIFQGLRLIEANECINLSEFKMEFMVYFHLVNEEEEEFERITQNYVIPYFEERGNYTKLSIYAKLLSDYYEAKENYLFALKYSKLLNTVYEKILPI